MEVTEKLQTELYNLTEMFVRAYQPRYYVQYRGDIRDLVSEFFVQFMTRKSRVPGKEQNLLEKFNPNITTLPYLVKVSVQRMLIDRSRSDKREVNYEAKVDEYGDVILASMNIVDEPSESIDDFDFDEDELELYKKAWAHKSPQQQKEIIAELDMVRNIINPTVVKFIDALIDTHAKEKTTDFTLTTQDGVERVVYQVTPKSFQLIHKESGEIITYNLFTGEARGRRGFTVALDSIQAMLQILNGRVFKLKR